MNLFQISEAGDFLAIQNFFKGFNSKTSRLVWMHEQNGEWNMTEVAQIPYLHRFCVVPIQGENYVVCCQLTRGKRSREDWSQPGRVLVGKLPQCPGPISDFTTVLDGIHKNHGLFYGRFHGETVVMVTGQEGLFCCKTPVTKDAVWHWEKLIDREISDCMAFDVDGDGSDEIITIEPFHGNKIVVNQQDQIWRSVHQYPCSFGHALWCGQIFGRPTWFIGYRQDNAALLMFCLREKNAEGDWLLDITTIDEHEAPTNIEVIPQEDKVQIFCSSGNKDRVVLYELFPS